MPYPIGCRTAADAGQVTVKVTRTGGDDGAVPVVYSTADGTARVDQEYRQRSGTLRWADGDDAHKTFQVPILYESLVESSETIGLALDNPTDGASVGTPGGGGKPARPGARPWGSSSGR